MTLSQVMEMLSGMFQHTPWLQFIPNQRNSEQNSFFFQPDQDVTEQNSKQKVKSKKKEPETEKQSNKI